MNELPGPRSAYVARMRSDAGCYIGGAATKCSDLIVVSAPVRKYLTLALAVVGAITIFVGAVVAIMGRGSDYKIERTMLSPDGSRVATLYTGMGGGAAGWCSQVISVNTDSDPFSLATEKKSGSYQVFRANCSAKIAFHWVSDSVLHIEFSAADQSGGLSLYMQPTDYSGQVRVEYAFGA